MNTGTVKFYKEDKGYGFVTDEFTKKDYFFHFSDCKAGNVVTNDVVTFEVAVGDRGEKAVKVTKQ